jgi:cell filamentation protein
LFKALEANAWLNIPDRDELIAELAPLYSDLNMIHPFRDGNGRAQRIMFEHIVINAGFEIDWRPISQQEWVTANIDSVTCQYATLEKIFQRVVGNRIPEH